MKRDSKNRPIDNIWWINVGQLAFLKYALPRERINLQGGTSEWWENSLVGLIIVPLESIIGTSINKL